MGTARDVDVFGYLDRRAYLRDLYLARKARGPSFRAFRERAGLRSPNALEFVIDGDRDLMPEMAARFAKACGLEGEAAAYFADLVVSNQPRRPSATRPTGA